MSAAPHAVFFPSTGLQVMTALIHFIGITVITHCLSRRLQHESLTIQGIRTMPWPRLAVILMFCDSWLFMITSGILVFGIGLEYSMAVCTIASYLCPVFYSTSKFFVYAFLAEKVHIVWSPTVGIRRFESPVYLVCMVTVSLYCIVMTLMLGGPIHEAEANGACVIGLKPLASIPILVYDIYINIFLTTMFLYPLLRSKVMSTGIRRLANRTFIAAILGLTTSTVNIVVLIILHGRELGWVNLGACAGDIILNGVAIFWVSGSKSKEPQSSSGAAERGARRQVGNTYSTHNVDSVHYTQNPKSSLAPQPETNTTSTFPKYSEGELEARPGHFKKQSISWVDRLFARDRTKDTQLKVRLLHSPSFLEVNLLNQIAVTTEFETEQSQIELQARPDSHSELDDDKSP
ncbi:hypothetical protein CVT26_014899 [Gymnopilus dilepis]|uniref:G-protein coupled receptors family 1 profile domain-containing protein n=1 Tax=Gymnopilus dilepis TaxID=231916 RepID=A0A409XWS1_9AGAR|nr:hypothetical protein CVT26_014899 [Gymnopilus dilepis]